MIAFIFLLYLASVFGTFGFNMLLMKLAGEEVYGKDFLQYLGFSLIPVFNFIVVGIVIFFFLTESKPMMNFNKKRLF